MTIPGRRQAKIEIRTVLQVHYAFHHRIEREGRIRSRLQSSPKRQCWRLLRRKYQVGWTC
jgi:hypothetical protein